MSPITRYAQHGKSSLAYQVVGEGEGEIDIVLIPSFVSHVEFMWSHPAIKAFLDRLSSFSRLAVFDKAGTGLSDPVSRIPTLEERADEVEAVMDAAGMERAALFGLSEGGPTAIFCAVRRPERTRALVLFGTYPFALPVTESVTPEDFRRAARERGLEDADVVDQSQLERTLRWARHVRDDWGEGKALKVLLPGQGDEAQLGRFERLSASPAMARATVASAQRLDVSDLLSSVAVPTLVVHATGDMIPIGLARLMARKIPGARLLEVPGEDHAPWLSSPDEIAGEIEQLLTGARHAPAPTRVLATVLFTDIVGSTEQLANLGDARWREVLQCHREVTGRRVRAAGGLVVKGTGDGFLSTFDGPAAAIRCTQALRGELAELGITIRAGLHTGEIERLGDDVAGLAVHIAARVLAVAGAGEILVSRTVGDLVVGSGLAFEDRGVHELKGVPDPWRLLAVAPGEALAGEAIDGPRAAQRPADRLVAAIARAAPGAIRTAIRLDPRHRNATRRDG